ncbi:PREDICTED: 60S ribosome subunit [Prunus dulcis]|uniref:PREDICTED: 60S ribosome subunit n=1 Tax=Prunus dulcis TaxID=3755 RepID=A0A5E4GPS1_PRUDU|nr:hypothetical protein L3X38_036302 [Prunus dulcis]VVA41646.1 PREDICTED: 60S ribosome subunit [Prunus dulcis]
MRPLDERLRPQQFSTSFSSSQATTSKTSSRTLRTKVQTQIEAVTASASTKTRFTHGGSFHLTVQCLSSLASNAKHKVWLKPTSEMSFLYGNHVLKGGLGRITENIVPSDGVVVFPMSDVPLGFGIAANSTQDCRKLDPKGIVVLHQTDIGEYLRMEDEL